MSSKFRLSPLSSSSCSSSSSLSSTREISVRRKSSRLNSLSSSQNSCGDQDILTIKVKKEPPEDEIKEYAANAMSELLGWYGYDKVDSGCTRGLNLDHFASSSSPKYHHQSTPRLTNKGTSPGIPRQSVSRSPTSRTSRSSPSISVVSYKENGLVQSSPPMSLRTGPASPRILENSDSASDTPDSSTTCSWCGRAGGAWEPGSTGSMSFGAINNSGRFCSEACFAAGRRAAFKRARTCDWCRHVRHSVSYVDFQDGESQLQFCSDKCLNQYKMNIFCHETQTHLALHGLSSSSPSVLSTNPSNLGGLITPELWLRDCRSPPPTPEEPEEDPLIVDDEPACDPEDSSPSQIPRVSPTREDTTSPNIDVEEATVEEAIKESLKDEENRRSQSEKHESLKSKDSEESDERVDPKPPSPKDNSLPRKPKPPENCLHLKDMRKLMSKGRQMTSSHPKPRKWLTDPIPVNPQVPRSSGLLNHRNLPNYVPHPQRYPLHEQITMGPVGPMGPPLHSYHPGLPPQINTSQTGLLPPVTVLVPYPIPIPIPIPVPIPIPLFGKFFQSRNSEDKEKKNCEGSTETTDSPQDLSKHRKFDDNCENLGEKLLRVDETVASPPVAGVSSLSPAVLGAEEISLREEKIVNLRRPLRKRRRLSGGNLEDVEGRIKRRSKILPV